MGCLCLSEPAPLCPSPHDNPGQAPERRIPALGPGVVGMFFVDHPLGSSLSPPERPRVGKGRWCIPAVPCGLAERAGAGGGVPRGGGSLEQEQDWEEWGAGVGPALLGSSKRPSGHSGYGAWTLGCCKLPPSKCISGNPKATCPPADSERAASVRGSSGAGAAHAPWTRCSPPHPPPLSGQAVGGGGGTHRG